jgi:hypothetical protein|tara:strand:+ start:20846 stop:21604 length:759 start_codon:yes stop_codon:yes gene_type:complete
MSILRVNEIRPQNGTSVSIPSGHSLVLGSTPLTSANIMPDPTGQAGKILVSDGSDLQWTSVGPTGITVFTSSATWIKPAGVSKIYVRLVGGGGAGSGVGETGAAGGYSERLIDVSGVSQVSVTIGLGSTSPTYYSGAAGGGTSSSFGSYMTCTGGGGGNQSHQHCGGLPGLGSGGDFNQYGGGGSGHEYYSGVTGGASYWGGSGASGHPQGGQYSANHQTHAAPGAGGSAGYHTSYVGAVGRDGICVIWEFK